MTTDPARVRAYYASFDEWGRLDTPAGALELRRALRLLAQHLPPRSRVLDLGGGPGRYAIALAAAGHTVTLADVSPELLAKARQKIAEHGATGVAAVDEVDARDLGRYPDGGFDAVVALGPFYHLTADDERRAAMREIARVTRPDGLAFVAFIPRLGGLVGLFERAAAHPEQVPEGAITAAMASGVFHSGATHGFQEGFYATVGELTALVEAHGFETVELVSLRSIANRVEATLDALPAALRAEAERLVEDVARDPAVVALGGHAVLVARRR